MNDADALAKEQLHVRYCALLYRDGTLEVVARRTGLDRRTVTKFVQRVPNRA